MLVTSEVEYLYVLNDSEEFIPIIFAIVHIFQIIAASCLHVEIKAPGALVQALLAILALVK